MDTEISSLIRRLLLDCHLTQRQLADVLAVSLDRVKSLSTGKAKKLTPNETEALVTKLRIRPDWIVGGGQGRMRMTQAEYARWLAAHAIPPALMEEIRQLHREQTEISPITGRAEVELLDNWRRCNKRDRETVSDLAARLAGDGSDQAGPVRQDT